jgi:hypothetical protein
MIIVVVVGCGWGGHRKVFIQGIGRERRESRARGRRSAATTTSLWFIVSRVFFLFLVSP